MPGILDGIKIVEMGHVVAVPSAAAIMADWGAEVIKIEPLTGEIARGIDRLWIVNDKLVERGDDEISWYIQFLNRNKKGIALNLKSDAGREILYKLVKDCDIFLSNYELNTLAALKADYTELSKINPGIIYGTISAYGTTGPEGNERGFDYTAAWARSGAMYMLGQPGCIPVPQRAGMMDRAAGGYLVAGVIAALLHRIKTGKGQNLDVSLFQVGTWTVADDLQAALIGKPPYKHDRTRAGNPLWNHYQTKDGRWFWVGMLQSDLGWPGFCRAIGRPELEKSDLYGNVIARWENRESLIKIIDDIVIKRTMAEWEKIFRENNLIYGRVDSPEEVINNPQAVANNLFPDLHHPDVDMKVVATPVTFMQDPASVRGPAPELGQHTEEILLGLDYTWEDIAGLKDKRIIL